jgi:hypothetical protein
MKFFDELASDGVYLVEETPCGGGADGRKGGL